MAIKPAGTPLKWTEIQTEFGPTPTSMSNMKQYRDIDPVGDITDLSLDENYSGKTDDPPYNSGLDAPRDDWRLIQMSPLLSPIPGKELQTSILKYEFIFEKLAKKNKNQIIKNGRDG